MTKPARWAEQRLNYHFDDPGLLDQALTHRSAASAHNERLEFLGDAVLDAVISHALFAAHPGDEEGGLTRLRALLVRRETLAEIARAIQIGSQLKLGSGERQTGGGSRASVLANALEAVIGAVFLDGGYTASETLVLRLFAERLANLPASESLKDPKTRLQETLQARRIAPPDYVLTEVTGPAHAQKFEVLCRVPALDVERRGRGSSRQRAEQDAAERVLEAVELA